MLQRLRSARKRGLTRPTITSSATMRQQQQALLRAEDGERPRAARGRARGNDGVGHWRTSPADSLPCPIMAAATVFCVASLRGELGDDAALAHHQHAVAHAEHLRQLARDHQDREALARRARTISRWISALAPTSMPRVGSSRISRRGLVASHLPSTIFCWLPPRELVHDLLGRVRLDVEPLHAVAGERPSPRRSR